MDKGDLVLLVINSLPKSSLVSDLDLNSENNAIRFRWGGKSFRVSETLSVDEVQKGFLLSSTNEAELMERLFKLSRSTGA